MADQVVNETSAEMTRAWRVALAVGRFMAMRREQALRAAQKSSTYHEQALRRAIRQERALAEKVYSEALTSHWWDSASRDEAVYVYGVAKRFSDIDPQAGLAARRCEREAKERWGIEVTAPMRDVEDIPRVEQALKVAPVLDSEDVEDVRPVVQDVLYRAYEQLAGSERREEILHYVHEQKDSAPQWLNDMWKHDLAAWLGDSEQVDARIRAIYPDIKAAQAEQAQAERALGRAREDASIETREASEALEADKQGSMSPGGEDTVKEVSEARHAGHSEQAAWDTLQARQAHAQALLDKGADPQSVRAAITADKGLHTPVRQAMSTVARTSTRRATPRAQKSARVQTRHM